MGNESMEKKRQGWGKGYTNHRLQIGGEGEAEGGRDKLQAINQQRSGWKVHPGTAGYQALDSPNLKGFLFVKGC